MSRALRTVGAVAPGALGELAGAAGCASLAEALRQGELVEVVVQDEFTHDVVVACAGRPGVYLVFDTT